MRQFLVAAAMLAGALLVTLIASTTLQSWATARAQPSSYEPPALVASPPPFGKKPDGTMSGAQRNRPSLTAGQRG